MTHSQRERGGTGRREDEIAAYWDGQAGSYDEQFDHKAGSPEEQAAWNRVLQLVTDGVSSLWVLDVGTGTGFLALELAARGHSVVGIDLSSEMLARARRKAADNSLSVAFDLGDAERPAYPDETFDLIISRHVFWALSDQPAALREWRRLLHPGGYVAILDGDWCTSTPAEPSASRYPASDAVRSIVAAHGFVDVKSDELTDLKNALVARAARERQPFDQYERYLVWGRRPV